MEGKALGKGLVALITEKTDVSKDDKIFYLATSLIKYNRLQPRSNYDESKLEDLKTSIRESGVLQPIFVREITGGYEVIAGERRLRAVRSLNLEKIPVIVKQVTDQEAFIISLIENIQREDLNPMEESGAYLKLINDFNYTQDAVAKSVGKDRSTISNMLRLLNLSDDIKKGLHKREISVGHARALLSIEDEQKREELFELIRKDDLSVRALENLVKNFGSSTGRNRRAGLGKDFELVSLEERLQKVLGTKVCIMHRRKRGKLVIEYYSLDDLDRIIKIIAK